MLLQSLLLVLSLQCFATTAGADDEKSVFNSSSLLQKPFEEILRTAKSKQRSGWRSQGTSSFGPRKQKTNVTKEKTSKDGEKSENPFHKIHFNFPALEGVLSAAPRWGRSWNDFENIAPHGVDGSKFLKNGREHGVARPQSSLRHVGKTENVSMVTDGREIEMATPAENNDKRKPVNDEDKNGVTEQHSSGHENLTLTVPRDGGKNSPQDERSGQPHSPHTSPDQYPLKISVNPAGKAQEVSLEESGTRKNSLGTISERFRMWERVKESGVPIGNREKAEMKAEKMVVWENGKIEERTREQQKTVDGRIDGDKKGERMIIGNQGVVEKMIEQEMLVDERTKGGKESKRMILGDSGKMKGVREQEMLVDGRTKGGKESKRMILGDSGKMKGVREQEMLVDERTKGRKESKRMILGDLGKMKGVREQEMLVSEVMKEFEKGERMIAERLNETNEGMRKEGTNSKERQGEGVTTGENMKTRDRKYIEGDQDDVTIRFASHQNGWLPSWIIKGRSRNERKERKIGNVVHIE